MRYLLDSIIFTADDEEPNCTVCDNQDFYGRCKNCGAKYGWRYYERRENNPQLVLFIKSIEEKRRKLK